MRGLTLLWILGVCTGQTLAADTLPVTIHVSPNGNDAWTGRLAHANAARTDGPVATPQRARDIVRAIRKSTSPQAPITVQLQGGRYELAETLTFTPEDSGTEKSPTIWTNAIGQSVILSGGTRVSPQTEGDYWVVTTPMQSEAYRHMGVGNAMRYPSRWPKQGTFTISGLAGADPKANYRTPATKFEFAPGQIRGDWQPIRDIEVEVLHFWVAGNYRIQSVDADKRVVTLDRPSIRRFTEDGGQKPGRFILRNIPDAIAPGEFHHDTAAKRLRYRPTAEEIREKATLTLPRLRQVVQILGNAKDNRFVEHLHLVGLTLADSRFDVGTKVAGDLQAAQHVPGSVLLRGAHRCRIENCRLVNLGGYGIELGDGCRNNTLARNELTQLGAGGIRQSGGQATSPESLRTGENRIHDNHIHHCGEVFPAGIGILSQHADRNWIAHNHIHHLYYTGISVGWIWGYAPSVSRDNIVEFNRIHEIGQGFLSDMGGIYMLGTSPGTIVRRNVVHDIESFSYGGWGIYTDEGSTGILIEQNLTYRTKSGGFHQHYGKDNIIRNNIFALGREAQLMRTRAEPHRSFTLERNIMLAKDAPLFAKNWTGDGLVMDHNLYWRIPGPATFPAKSFAEWQKRGLDRHSLIADPKFRNLEQLDFTLAADSPAKSLGFVPFDPREAGIRPASASSR
ncbi:right-handed parallel beta-helix repeat-containing protein [Tuwongella immobilis]|uniref:Right handed beta helix domain-containing protein n=1 Tax=Tuwongella immobilis TaxID=692036 RepID=A0A6C2YRL6_9BACT|nr:right-handed parallel beta-helix repeat-containing protein [Tuwongella immobilis]VIP03809.1 Putative pectin lyase OS=Chthonomonas calidirosea (strain DSM 23976 / ICMP 18418 / T49) GN=CCALI_00133 PE=4 SV=1: Beta_helix [Tuwongella immobilis]VTS04985.1 Putative pectin lyase OS=Chthonomonas calidirosea (strain DSM 23976 / ICMP 18418 / T49) GN=CCALI_00133 PE=4 SV=1: Beta_helix [Tuwongella immobilis]